MQQNSVVHHPANMLYGESCHKYTNVVLSVNVSFSYM